MGLVASELPQAPASTSRYAPLTERMRPRTLADYAGQQHLIGEDKPLRLVIERDESGSMIFLGLLSTGSLKEAKHISVGLELTLDIMCVEIRSVDKALTAAATSGCISAHHQHCASKVGAC